MTGRRAGGPRGRPRLALVRQRRRGQRHLVRARPGRDRPARSERRRQDDAAPPPRGPAPAVGRHGHGRRAARLGEPADVPPPRPRPRARGGARLSHRPGVRAAQREAAGPPRRRHRRRAGDRHRRPGGRRRPADRHVLEGHAPADQACRRARPRPADPAPRRAVQRHGPAPAAAHDRAAAVHGRRRVARSSSRRTSSRRSSGWPIRSWSSTPVGSRPPATSARSAG